MRGPGRQKRPGRREPFRDPRPTVLIFCEGRETEKQYLEKFARHHRNARIRVEVAGEVGVPFSLVRFARQRKLEIDVKARRQKDENIAYDSVWCVFDIDEHPQVPDAKNMAAENGIHLAISNPCFELWLILHLRESPGMQDRHKVRGLLKKRVPGYDKHVEFRTFAPGYSEAVKRARRLETTAHDAGTPGHNPTTNVYD